MKRRFILGFTVFTAVVATALAMQVRMDIPVEELAKKYAAPPSRFIVVDGMKVHYRDEGKGFPLVLIHGTASSLHTWDGWTAALSGRFRIIRMDLPAFGLTGPSPSRDYRIGAYVKFIDDFMKALGVEKFHLAGNSLGGSIAWNYALAHPKKIGRLILIDAAGYPQKGSSSLNLAKTPVLKDILRFITPRFMIDRAIKSAYGDPGRVTEELVTRYYDMMLREGNRLALVDRMKLPREDGSSLIKTIKVPVLLLWGSEDRWIPVDHANRFKKDIPGAALKVYPGIGHIPMEEIPEPTAGDVMDFLL